MATNADPGDAAYAALVLQSATLEHLSDEGIITEHQRKQIILRSFKMLQDNPSPQSDRARAVLETLFVQK